MDISPGSEEQRANVAAAAPGLNSSGGCWVKAGGWADESLGSEVWQSSAVRETGLNSSGCYLISEAIAPENSSVCPGKFIQSALENSSVPIDNRAQMRI